MTAVYFFEIPDDFVFGNHAKPENKHLSSLLGQEIVKIVAKKTLKTKEILLECENSGKPYLKNFPNFHFNISHSGNAVVVAFCETPVGIDIEKITELKPKVAERYFTAEENQYIKNSPSPDLAFCEIWTSKEAYFKRSGKGIGTDFSKTSILTDDIKKHIHTFKHNNFLISVCCDNPQNLEFHSITKDLFNNNFKA